MALSEERLPRCPRKLEKLTAELHLHDVDAASPPAARPAR
jgi:hypothetical protein